MADYEALLGALLKQEDLLQFGDFSNDTAIAVGLRIVDTARKERKGVTIDIRRHGQQLFHCALPGTSADNDAWVRRKVRVVNRFGHSSYYMGVYFKSQGTTIEEKALLDPTRYAAHGGAFPVIVKGAGVVGTITVSGLPQEEDHRLVVRILAEYLDIPEVPLEM
jgi:uncharacterized protein (UPF0303 family)